MQQNINSPQKVLQQYWGYNQFRPLQTDIIQSVIDGKDTVALLPTGGGKSLCFQVPAMLKPGFCLVISPLIALMKDQVENLEKRNIKAKAIYSGLNYKEINLILNNACLDEDLKFLYVSPERLNTSLFLEKLPYLPINLLAIDEAHCISQWGHDFRPEYRQIAELRKHIPDINIIALTATATKQVVADIEVQLALKTPGVFAKSFERKNLQYIVRQTENKAEKLLSVLTNSHGSGLVYVRNRKQTEEIAKFLTKNNIKADFYHAGINGELRSQKQNNWIQNKTRIMVCTNAFGMGIDKPDCRVVVHFEMPDCLEAYYQEAGRAGRDEKPAFCVLLHDASDDINAKKKIGVNYPDINEISLTYQAICDYLQVPVNTKPDRSFDFDIIAFVKRYNFDAFKTYSCLKILEQADLILLSEAFYEPSKIKIICNHEALYKFQVANDKFDAFTKVLLRSYGGLFDNYIRINELEIANRIALPVASVYKYLDRLHQLEIIDYIKTKEVAQLVFTTDRQDVKYLSLNKKHLAERKQTYIEKMQAMMAYAKPSDLCRSRQLLEYFNDYSANDCGYCDVCIDKKKVKEKTELTNVIKEEIIALVKQNPISSVELFEQVSTTDMQIFTIVLRLLLDNNILRYDSAYQLHCN
ncbi:MAG: RecQ family ATP-dependent DNA helicase [Bacteroidia bacterium]